MAAQSQSARLPIVRPATTPSQGAKGMRLSEAYRLSRIEAEGWNAAHRSASIAPDVSAPAEIDSLNPYATDPERARWNIGFTKALQS